MITIVGIQFKGMGRIYYFDPLNTTFEKGDYVVVETVRGVELGFVIIGNRDVEEEQIEYELKPILRKATKKDLEDEKRNNEQAEKNFIIFKKYVNQLSLDMKPLYCEYTLDHSKLIFYYSSDDRVDFRELLKLLASEFKTRIELRQIGPREAARIIGGIGTCGQVLCCQKYLREFDFVTMKMAKEQSMSLNNAKISGACGKLMCCIAYESELYKELRKEIPGVGTYVKTPTCDCCKVVGVDYIKKIVRTQENPNGMPTAHEASKVEVVNLKKGKETTEVVTTVEIIDNTEEVKEEENQIVEPLNEEENVVIETKTNVVEVNRSEEKKHKKKPYNKNKHFKHKKAKQHEKNS